MPLRRELPRHDDRRARRQAARAAGRASRARAAILDTWAGLPKINVSTGEMTPTCTRQRAPSNGAVLTTGGDLVFWGDLDHMFRAFDAESGKMLWETDAQRPDSEQHDHLCGERQAVRRGVDRHRRDHRRADRSGADQAEPSVQRARRLRIAVRFTGSDLEAAHFHSSGTGQGRAGENARGS